jgi:MscS family membrane protein
MQVALIDLSFLPAWTHPPFWILLAFVLGWILRKILNWVSLRMPNHPVGGALIAAIGITMPIALAAGAFWFVVGDAHAALEKATWASQFDTARRIFRVYAVFYFAFQLTKVAPAYFQVIADRSENKLDDVLVPISGTVLRAIVVVYGFIQCISVINSTAAQNILAGVGVGGLAFGFAAQDTIKNFFGFVMLMVDKPFELGDTIDAAGLTGVVEAIGLRSTRVRTPDGQLVTVPNGELANRSLTNVTERPYIRTQHLLELSADTDTKHTEEALVIVRQIFAGHRGAQPAHPPRIHLERLSSAGPTIRIFWWYYPAAAWDCATENERLLTEIRRKFEAAKITLTSLPPVR